MWEIEWVPGWLCDFAISTGSYLWCFHCAFGHDIVRDLVLQDGFLFVWLEGAAGGEIRSLRRRQEGGRRCLLRPCFEDLRRDGDFSQPLKHAMLVITACANIPGSVSKHMLFNS